MVATLLFVIYPCRMKTGDLFADFEWTRAADGYRWQRTSRGLLLMPAQDDGEALRTIVYKPFSKPYAAMFRQFLALNKKLDHDTVLAFANSHGLLGYPVTVQVVDKAPPTRLWPEGLSNMFGTPDAVRAKGY